MKASSNVLFFKMVIVSILCVGITMSILMYFVLDISTNIVEQNARNGITTINKNKANQIDSIFKDLMERNEMMASMPATLELASAYKKGEDLEQKKSALRPFLNWYMNYSDGLYENVFLQLGDRIAVDGIGGTSEGFKMRTGTGNSPSEIALKSGRSFIAPPRNSPITSRQVMLMLTPVKDPQSSENIAIYRSAIDLTNMAENVVVHKKSASKATNNIADVSSTYLINSDGLVLLSNDKSAILNLNLKEAEGTSEFFSAMADKSSGLSKLHLNNVEYMGSFSRLSQSGLTLVSVLPNSYYINQINQLRNDLIIYITIGALVCSLLLVVLFYAITKPLLSRLSIAMFSAENIAKGKLDTDIPTPGNDEGTRLLTALNNMQTDLRGIIQHIIGSSKQLSESATEFNQQALEATQAVQTQTLELEHAATAASQLTSAFESVAVSAAQAAESSQAGTQHAQEGKQSVEKTISAIQSLANGLDQTSGSIESLATRVEEVGSVLEVISNVAEQINLLALNAAIESARAGEAGRGFAVVADEVRSLAHRTADSTTQINDIIEAVRQESQRAVQDIAQKNAEAHKVLDVANSAGEALQLIDDIIGQIYNGNLTIASATEEQSQVIKEVDRNLDNIRVAANNTNHGLKEINHASDELAELAVDLNNTVNRFTV